MKKVFIDGSSGTTGLRIYERLKSRDDIELMEIEDSKRKDLSEIKKYMDMSDVTFLCLPDDAAREAVTLSENPDTIIIDTSTAHRVAEGWTYGFAEIGKRYEAISKSKRIANPGCHACGFISLTAPLTESNAINKNSVLSCFSLTGYSGGGKKMIAEYENPDTKNVLNAPRVYGISQVHKHLPEMQKIGGVENAPIFCPTVSSFYSGMEVVVTLSKADTDLKISEIKDIYKSYYTGNIVRFNENADESGFLSASKFTGLDSMEICVYGNDERMILVSRFDNLGKGASGSAIQNMNIALGFDECKGLILQ